MFKRPEEQGVVVMTRAVDRDIPRKASADVERNIGQGAFDFEVYDNRLELHNALTRMSRRLHSCHAGLKSPVGMPG